MEYVGGEPATFLNEGGAQTSDLLDEELWPLGYDKEKLNKISLGLAMKMRKLQDKNKKDEEERAPGVSISKPDKPIKMVNVLAGKDDATTILHASRFTLRPIASPPKSYWVANMQKKRKDAPANPSVAFLGATQQVNKDNHMKCKK